MRTLLFSSFCICVTVANTNYWDAPEEDHVAVLSKYNFDAFLKSNRHAFVKFYAPWCGHCKIMAPSDSKSAQRMKAAPGGAVIAKFNASVDGDLASKYNIKGFPTLKLFIDGEPVDYSEGREENTMYVG